MNLATIKFIFRILRHKCQSVWQKISLYRSFILLCLLFSVSIVTPGLIAKISNANPSIHNQEDGIQLVQKSQKQYEAGNFTEALASLEQAESIFIEQKDDLNQAMILSNLSLVYQQMGRFNDGAEAIDKSLTLLKDLPPSQDKVRIKAQSLDIKGQLQRERNQSKEALDTWKQANQLYSQLNNQEAKAQNQFKQILVMEDLGLYFNACKGLVKELDINIKINESDIYVKDCQPFKLNENKSNEKNYKIFKSGDRQIDIKSAQPDSLLKVQQLQKLGETIRVEQELPQYRHLLKEAILTKALYLATKLEPSAIVNDQIASIYLSLGNIASANEQFFTSKYCQTALDCYKKGKKIATSEKLKIQAQLNQLSLIISESKPSSETYELAHEIKSSLRKLLAKQPLSRFSVNSQINLAQTLLCSYKTSLDAKILEQSSPILQQCQSTKQEAKQISGGANLAEIAQIVTQAINQAQEIGNRHSEAFAHGLKGSIYQQIALESLDQQQAIENLEKAQAKTRQALDPNLISSFYEPQITYLWHWQLGRLLKAQSALAQTAEAKNVYLKKAKAAYKEAYLIVNSLRADLLNTKREVQFDFRDRFEPIYREYVSLQFPVAQENNKSAKFTPLEESTEDIQDIRRVIADLQLAELENFLECNLAQDNPKFVNIDDVIDSDQKTSAIYPIILDDRIEVLLKLPNKKLYRRSPPVPLSRTEVNHKLQQLRQELEQPYFSSKRGKPAAQEVYNWLIAPAEKQGLLKQVQTLVFVLDGAFRNIPMAALYDGKEYLVEKYAIAVALGNLKLPDSKPKTQFKALIAGLSQKPQCENPECNQFGSLEYVEQEVNGIIDVLRESKIETTRLYDEEFTSNALEKEIHTAPYNIVHLATHGEFGFSRDSTFILTAPPESQDKFWRKKDNLKSANVATNDFEDIKTDLNELDNLLQVRKQEPIELLVLSACETGEGDNREVLGIAGMAVQSGARSTVASLWSIDDSSTAELMKQFYENLTTGLTKAEALRQAQNYLLQEYPGAYKPSHWAPYILVGDWR